MSKDKWFILASSAGLSMGFSLRMGFEKKYFSYHPIRRVRCPRRRLGLYFDVHFIISPWFNASWNVLGFVYDYDSVYWMLGYIILVISAEKIDQFDRPLHAWSKPVNKIIQLASHIGYKMQLGFECNLEKRCTSEFFNKDHQNSLHSHATKRLQVSRDDPTLGSLLEGNGSREPGLQGWVRSTIPDWSRICNSLFLV